MNPNEHHGSADLAARDESSQVPAQAPLGTGDFADEFGGDPLAGSGGARRLQGGSILVIAVVLIAVTGLFSMRKLAEITKGSGIDREIEATIEKILPSLDADKDPNDPNAARDKHHEMVVMAVLSESYSNRQVPLRDVQRDPFIIGNENLDIGKPPPPPPVDGTLDQERRLRELQTKRRQQVEQAGSSLELKAIMDGSTRFAIINGSTKRVDDTVVVMRGSDAVEFRVASIDEGIVRLVVEDEALNLTKAGDGAMWVLLTLRK